MPTSPRARAWLFDVAALACCTSATWLVFGQCQSFAFLNFDDPGYVTHNPEVRAGLTLHGLRWAFSTFQEGHYHPLTWLSHMAVVQAFGLSAAAHHAVNVALHAFNAMLLYLVLARATGMRWRALAAALLFAIHPLRAESVAWVSERKDVLCGAFWLLACACYVQYARTNKRSAWYATLALYAFGLLAKPMLISLPIALLLLDVWPLRRIDLTRRDVQHWRAPLLEKLPFLAFAAASACVRLYGQHHEAALLSVGEQSLWQRFANASTAYLAYLGHWLVPVESAIFHPLRNVPVADGIGALLGLVAITHACFRARHTAPALLAGWLWFLVTLLPVIGLVQIGGQARADRFTYLPSIGLGIALIWSVPARLGTRALPPMAAALTLLLLALWAQREVSYFKDSERLWTHALDADSDNFMAHNNLGVALDAQGRFAESEPHYREAVRQNPGYPPAHTNLGNALARRGDYAGAIEQFELALRRQPQLIEAQYDLGLSLARLGRYPEAAEHYREALRLSPRYAVAHWSLGALLVGLSQRSEGVYHLQRAVELEPSWPEPRALLARLEAQ